jgi:hypothetical protein
VSPTRRARIMLVGLLGIALVAVPEASHAQEVTVDLGSALLWRDHPRDRTLGIGFFQPLTPRLRLGFTYVQYLGPDLLADAPPRSSYFGDRYDGDRYFQSQLFYRLFQAEGLRGLSLDLGAGIGALQRRWIANHRATEYAAMWSFSAITGIDLTDRLRLQLRGDANWLMGSASPWNQAWPMNAGLRLGFAWKPWK